jgi:hypothetical protein
LRARFLGPFDREANTMLEILGSIACMGFMCVGAGFAVKAVRRARDAFGRPPSMPVEDADTSTGQASSISPP